MTMVSVSKGSKRPQETAAGVLTGPYRVPTLGIISVVSVLAFEGMAVGTVMPVTVRDLGGLPLYAWAFSAYLIASLLANVLAGDWSDRRGPDRPLLSGLAVFVAGLLISGIAPTMWIFVMGRAVQGLGSGASVVSLYVIVARVYPEELRPRIFAAMAGAWVVPSLVGPSAGGLVAEHLDWRWVFLGMMPLVLPAVAMLTPALRGSRRADTHTDAGPEATRRWRRSAAAVAAAGGAGALLYAIDHPGPTVAFVVFALAGLAGLGTGLPILMPRGTLRLRRGVPSVIAARGLLAGAFFGAEAFIPLALTTVHGFTPTMAGLTLTFSALGWSAGSFCQGRSGAPRSVFVITGATLVLAGVLGVTLSVYTTGWLAAPTWVLAGTGMGFSLSSLSVLTLNQSGRDEQGTNSAALQISDTLGSSLAVGTGGALLTGLGRLTVGLGAGGILMALLAVTALGAAFRLERRA